MDKTYCLRCQREIDVEDHFCRHCGQQLRPVEGGSFVPVQIVPEIQPPRPKIGDNPWFVLMMLFLVLGPLALPMLWQGRAFTLRWKWIWTVLLMLYTLLLCWALWFLTVKTIIEPLQKLRF
jgi:hypothetical protein